MASVKARPLWWIIPRFSGCEMFSRQCSLLGKCLENTTKFSKSKIDHVFRWDNLFRKWEIFQTGHSWDLLTGWKNHYLFRKWHVSQLYDLISHSYAWNFAQNAPSLQTSPVTWENFWDQGLALSNGIFVLTPKLLRSCGGIQSGRARHNPRYCFYML